MRAIFPLLIVASTPLLAADYTQPPNEAAVIAKEHRAFMRELAGHTYHLLERNSTHEVYYTKMADTDDSPHLHIRYAVVQVFNFKPDENDSYSTNATFEFRCELHEYGELYGHQDIEQTPALFDKILNAVCKE